MGTRKLYDLELSGNCYKVRLFCALLGLKLDLAPVDLMAGAHKKSPLIDMNPYGDADFYVEGFNVPIAPTSTIVDAYIAHRMVIEAVAEMKKRGLEPPVFRSANLPEGDAFNAKLLERYKPRVKDL